MRWGCIPFLPETNRKLGVFVTVVKWVHRGQPNAGAVSESVRYSYETVRIWLLHQRLPFHNPRNLMVGTMRKNQIFVLCALAALFVMRVAGQFAVAFFHVGFLPPMEAWMSGVMPYPWLLGAQIAIIFLMAKVCLDLQRGNGFFARRGGRFGRFLLEGGALYLLVMSLRYAIHMALYPHERWLGGAIPIFFHVVLAGFILVWGSFHLQAVRKKVGNRWTARVFRVFAVLGILVWVAYLLAPYVMAQQFHLRPAVYAVKIERDVQVPVAAGVMLVAGIYHPMGLERSPTVLVRIPYTKTPTNMLTANIIGRLWAEVIRRLCNVREAGAAPEENIIRSAMTERTESRHCNGCRNSHGMTDILLAGAVRRLASASGLLQTGLRQDFPRCTFMKRAQISIGCSIQVGHFHFIVRLLGL